MSDDQAAELDDRPHSAATDPHNTIAAGDRPDNWHPASGAVLSDAEREHNAQMFGVTYRERTRREHTSCVSYCIAPGQRKRGTRCPGCYGKVDIRAIGEADIEPCPTRAERFAAWAGGWVAAFCEALLFPFRVGRAHTAALVRDLLQESVRAEMDGWHDILQVAEALEGELRAIRDAVEAATRDGLCGRVPARDGRDGGSDAPERIGERHVCGLLGILPGRDSVVCGAHARPHRADRNAQI